MKKVKYIGTKPVKHDNVAGTGLTWRPDEVIEIADDGKADKLLQHKTVWVDAENYTGPSAEQLLAQRSHGLNLPVRYVVIAVAREDLDRLMASQAVVQIVHTGAAEAAGGEVNTVGAVLGGSTVTANAGLEKKAAPKRWDSLKKPEIIRILKDEFGLEGNFSRYTDIEMREFAEGIETEQKQSPGNKQKAA